MYNLSEEELKVIFSQNLNYYLNLFNKSQKEVADAIDVIPTTFSSWTRGISLPRMGKVEKLADYFGIKKTDLIEERSHNTDDKYSVENAKLLNSIKNNENLRKFLTAYMQLPDVQQESIANMVYSLTQNK